MTDKNVPYEDQPCGNRSFSNRESVNQVLASARLSGYTPDPESAALLEDLATGRKTSEEVREAILARVERYKAQQDGRTETLSQ